MSNLIIPSETNVVDWKNNRWWAERGLIRCEDKNTGEYSTFTVRAILERLRGLNDMLANSRGKKSKSSDGFYYTDEVRDHQQYIEQMVALCEIARKQGEPTNPKARKEVTERLKRRKTTVSGFNTTF